MAVIVTRSSSEFNLGGYAFLPDNGFVTPIITGFGSVRGLLFVAPDADKDGGEK
jgi:hypothetical protein